MILRQCRIRLRRSPLTRIQLIIVSKNRLFPELIGNLVMGKLIILRQFFPSDVGQSLRTNQLAASLIAGVNIHLSRVPIFIRYIRYVLAIEGHIACRFIIQYITDLIGAFLIKIPAVKVIRDTIVGLLSLHSRSFSHSFALCNHETAEGIINNYIICLARLLNHKVHLNLRWGHQIGKAINMPSRCPGWNNSA